MLHGIDTLVVDLQDIGSRYYTYAWTMAMAMRVCAEAKISGGGARPPESPGRPAPRGQHRRARATRRSSASIPLPVRHGLTIGERATHMNKEHGIGCDLTVVPMRGWRRDMRWEDTGLPWVPPSPNMPTLDTARVYPGGCLIEGTNLSEGRGTTLPFELVGAPFLDGERLARDLGRRGLPGAAFRPASFIPAFHKHKGQVCHGVQVHVIDAERFKPFATYLALIVEARRQSRGFRWKPPPYEFERRRLPIDLLCGGDAIRRAIERGAPLAQMERSWQAGLATFGRARRPYLLYS